MTDATLNRFNARGTAAQRIAFTPSPPTPSSGPSPGYFWHETDTGDSYAYNGSGWDKVNIGAASSFTSWKDEVRAATTANGTLSTAFANGQAIDGVTLATGDRILLKNQTTATENGIYVVAASGAPTRATDADSAAEMLGAIVPVMEGTVNADKVFKCTNNATITLGTTNLVFIEMLDLASAGSQGDVLYRGANGWARLAAGTSGQVLATGGASANPSWADAAAVDLGALHVQDQKASATDAGTFTSGAWQTRTLNTTVVNTITSASLATNQITLPAGTYDIHALAPARNVSTNQARLQNITDTSTTLLGTTTTSGASSGVDVSSIVRGRFTIAGAKVFELQHRCVTTVASSGLGAGGANNWGTNVFSDVFIRKVA